MTRLVHYFILVWFISSGCAQEDMIRVLDGSGDFVVRTESPETELNHATLSEDSNGNLPEKFTICAATFLANWIGNFAWFDLLKEDGSHWVFFYQKVKNLDQDSSKLNHSLWMNVNGVYYYNGDFGPFEYNRWVHLCIGFNLKTEVVSVVADGTVMEDKEVPGLGEGRPVTLAEKLILGKSNRGGKWKQDCVSVSSVEIFRGILDKRDMVSRSHGNDCGGPGDYLSWSQVKQPRYQLFRSIVLVSWSQAIQHCLRRWCGGFKDQASSGQTQPKRSFAGKGTRCVLSAPPKQQWQQASGLFFSSQNAFVLGFARGSRTARWLDRQTAKKTRSSRIFSSRQ